jgi:hypothetical protein
MNNVLSTWRLPAIAGILGVGAVAALACSTVPDGNEATGQSSEAVYGSSVATWTNGSASPWGGVARISISFDQCRSVCSNGIAAGVRGCANGDKPMQVCGPSAQPKWCSGTLIARDLVLTGGHCVCDIDNRNGSTITSIQLMFPADPTRPVAGTLAGWTIDDCSAGLEDDASQDLAMIRLASNVGEDLVASPLIKPYLDSDPWTFFAGDYTGPTVAGYGGTLGSGDEGTLQFATYENGVQFDDDNAYTFGTSTGAWWMFAGTNQGAGIAPGDSGGPYAVFKRSERRWYQLAINKGGSMIFLQPDRDTFSPTWNNGDGNGTWIASFLNDADDDQVSDPLDNCNPTDTRFANCIRYPSMCSNPTQLDTDGDGVGDQCDNCPGTSNPSQSNADSDGEGDACDGCPYAISSGQDADEDGVYDACDNCGEANGYRACTRDSDCGSGVCTEARRCTRQVDDTDGDGVGGTCDRCTLVIETDRVANSNAHAESAKEVTRLQDMCDPVPLYVTEPVSEKAHAGVVPPADDGTRNIANTLSFSATAQIGHDTSGLTTPTPAGALPRVTYNGRVGFRYCDCDRESGPLEEAACISMRCPVDPGEYLRSDVESPWKRLTVATGTMGYPALSADLARGAELDRTYTSDFSAASGGGNSLIPRLGRGEGLFWTFWKDLSATGQGGRVASRVRDGRATIAGLFWSHTLGQGYPNASTRDGQTLRELRDSYRMVQAPFFHLEYVRVPPAVCGLSCGPWIDPSVWQGIFVSNPDPTRRPLNPDLWGGISRLRPSLEDVAAIRGNDSLDLTAILTPAVRDELMRPGVKWATVAESVSELGTRNIRTIFASVSSPWTSSGVIREFEAATDGNVALRPAVAASGLRPGARSGARTVLSAFERSVYLVGGTQVAPNGSLGAVTPEVWRYSLDSGAWTKLGKEGTIPGAALTGVMATAYDSTLRQLYVLSTTQTTSAFGSTTALRLTAVDTVKGTARTLGSMPALAASAHVSLGVTRDRTLVLAAQKDAQTVQVFELDPRPATPLFTGYAAMTGKLDGDLFASGELSLPLATNGVTRVVGLTRAVLRQKVGVATAGDFDKDGILDALDDCPKSYNPLQTGCPSAIGAVLHASSRLVLADRVEVVGANSLIQSAGTFATTIGIDATVGNVQSKSSVSLGDRTRARGSVVTSGSVTLGSQAGADGGIKSSVPVSVDTLASFSVTFPTAGAAVTLAVNEQRAIAPGSHGAVTLNTASVLFLRSGDYYFTSLDVQPQSVLVLDDSAGPVRIYVKSSLIFRGSAQNSLGAAPDFLLAYMGTTAATIESAFDGTIVAPNATITLGSVAHSGAFYAKELVVQAGAKITYVTPVVNWSPIPR